MFRTTVLVLLAALALAHADMTKRADADAAVYEQLSVRTADGLEAIARAASPAALARAFGERCCAVCTPAGSDNCNCCGKCC